ncbi:MAG TPA: hypothetical protein VKU00_17160, partial [Chthonomonadaceae bacterium]|nr:hypothetical protein [Chthonomonadaceae bacterium]
PEGVYGRMEYRDELYSPTTILRLVHDYETMVQAYCQDPDLALDAPEAIAPTAAKTDARERMRANRAKLLERTPQEEPEHRIEGR